MGWNRLETWSPWYYDVLFVQAGAQQRPLYVWNVWVFSDVCGGFFTRIQKRPKPIEGRSDVCLVSYGVWVAIVKNCARRTSPYQTRLPYVFIVWNGVGARTFGLPSLGAYCQHNIVCEGSSLSSLLLLLSSLLLLLFFFSVIHPRWYSFSSA